jgi:N-acetylated-alpha-linked acidic dipeptidase
MNFGGPYGVYHALYDNFYWMEKFGDPEFLYHAAMTNIVGLMAMTLADRPAIPIDVLAYAKQLRKEIKSVQTSLKELETKPVTQLDDLAQQVNAWIKVAESWRKTTPSAANLSLMDLKTLNSHLIAIDRAFISPEGLKGRTWYKNLFVAPGENTGYAAETLPSLRDCINKNELDRLPIEESRLLKAVEAAIAATQAAVDLVQQGTATGGR